MTRSPVGPLRYPRALMDKLGVKPGLRVSVLGIEDAFFWAQLATRSVDVSRRARRRSDLVFVAMDAPAQLVRLKALREKIVESGAIWVVWPKGRKAFREDDVRAFGPEAGLVDVKVVAFSGTLSALKMVVPLALRRAPRQRR